MSWQNDDDPWGSGEPKKQKKSRPRPELPDLEVFLKQFQDFFRKKGGSTSGSGKFLALVMVAILGLWMATGIYKIQPNEEGVILRFGKAVRTAYPGLNYHLPYPIETLLVEDVTALNRVQSQEVVGRSLGSEEHTMLTGDENLIEVYFTVLWSIKDVEKYLFTAKSPKASVRVAAESVVREIVSQMKMMSVLTEGRSVINHRAKEMLQQLMDQYGLGIEVREFLMGRIDLPAAVIDYYRDVQRAKADQERMVNKAQAYMNSVVPVARGQAQQKIQRARGYRQKVISRAKGQASRFQAVQTEYRKRPQVVKDRLYIQTLHDIVRENPKVIMDSSLGGGSNKGGVLPVLHLDSPGRDRGSQTNSTAVELNDQNQENVRGQ